jgi:hypothetical protein
MLHVHRLAAAAALSTLPCLQPQQQRSSQLAWLCGVGDPKLAHHPAACWARLLLLLLLVRGCTWTPPPLLAGRCVPLPRLLVPARLRATCVLRLLLLVAVGTGLLLQVCR